MSLEHSLICDRCGAVVAAASTLALARADAAALGAVRVGRQDLCRDCSTGREAAMTRGSTCVHEPIDSTAELSACARCPMPGCGSDLYISTHSSRPVFLSDTSDNLANAAPFTSTWEIGCGEGHVLLLPPGADDDHDTFGQARDDEESEDDLVRLRRLIAQGPAGRRWALLDRWAVDDCTLPSMAVVGSVGASRDVAWVPGGDLDRIRGDRAQQSEDDRG